MAEKKTNRKQTFLQGAEAPVSVVILVMPSFMQ